MSDRAAELRREFDASFQVEPALATPDRVDLLVIVVGDHHYGLRLRDVEAVVKEKTVTPLPGAPAGLRGIAGFRGRLVAVHDLAHSLGLSGGSRGWLALVSAPDQSKLGLAFDALEAQLRLHPEELLENHSHAHVDALVRRPEGPLSVLAVASLVAAVTQGAG